MGYLQIFSVIRGLSPTRKSEKRVFYEIVWTSVVYLLPLHCTHRVNNALMIRMMLKDKNQRHERTVTIALAVATDPSPESLLLNTLRLCSQVWVPGLQYQWAEILSSLSVSSVTVVDM